jgi:hypothetical protein
MRVNSLFNVPGSRKPRKRIGRGMVVELVELVGVERKVKSLALVFLLKLKVGKCRL